MGIERSFQEKELLKQLSNSNPVAFEKIYYLYSPRLFSSLVKLVKSDAAAQEIIQDVFLKVWENRNNIDPEKSFRSYLYTIAENKAYDFFRKVVRDKKLYETLIVTATEHYEHIETEYFHKEDSRILEMAIRTLPTQRQLVFRLSKLEDMSYDEISKKLGISVSTISDHIVKANKSIRKFLTSHPELLMLIIVSKTI
jgi:RNA polymerase sigma-70 factor (family 1)